MLRPNPGSPKFSFLSRLMRYALSGDYFHVCPGLTGLLLFSADASGVLYFHAPIVNPPCVDFLLYLFVSVLCTSGRVGSISPHRPLFYWKAKQFVAEPCPCQPQPLRFSTCKTASSFFLDQRPPMCARYISKRYVCPRGPLRLTSDPAPPVLRFPSTPAEPAPRRPVACPVGR